VIGATSSEGFLVIFSPLSKVRLCNCSLFSHAVFNYVSRISLKVADKFMGMVSTATENNSDIVG